MNDETLERHLSALVNETPPDRVVDAAKAAWTWRTVDEELAELAFDSLDLELTGARGGTDTRELTFASEDTEVELVGTPTGPIVGQVLGGAAAWVALEGPAGSERTVPDEAGRFRFDAARRTGPLRLRVGFADGSTVTTDPFLL